jgi:hypothetical protein
MLRQQPEGCRILDEEELRVFEWQRSGLMLGAGECRTMLDRSWTGLVAVDCDDESGAIKSSAGTSSIFGGTSAQSMCKTSHCVFSIDQHAPSSPLAQLYTISHQKTLLFLLSTKHHIFLLSIRC